MSDIIDRIDELVDEQLAAGEPRTGYNYDDPQYPKCPHCGRHWHGLPITAAIARMYSLGRYQPEYIHAADDSPTLCEGSEFIGPIRANGLTYGESVRRAAESVTLTSRREVRIHFIVDYRMADQFNRMRDQFASLAAHFQRIESGLRGTLLRGGRYPNWVFTPASPNPEPRHDLPDIDWKPGPHNWGCELRTRTEEPALQFPRESGWQLRWDPEPHPLQPLIDEHWHEFTAPEHPLPEFTGFDFTKYVSDDDPTWRIAPGWRSR